MLDYLAALEAALPWFVYGIALGFGLIVGSFLNVVIFRTPVMLQREWEIEAHQILDKTFEPPGEPFNLVFPNSHCPACHHQIRPWENVPVISYLFLRGRCSACGIHISLRYPLIELLTGVLTMLVVIRFGPNVMALACALLTFGLIAGAMIDYDHKLIPDDITLPLLWLGLIINYFEVIVPFGDAFWGAVCGYLILWSIYQLFKLVTGKEGMGYGDFKLLAMLGAWLGWQALPLVIILSSFAGAMIGGTLIALGRARDNPIPFGPYLAIAGFITLLWGERITSSYLRFASF